MKYTENLQPREISTTAPSDSSGQLNLNAICGVDSKCYKPPSSGSDSVPKPTNVWGDVKDPGKPVVDPKEIKTKPNDQPFDYDRPMPSPEAKEAILKTADGDVLVRQQGSQSLALNTGEGLKVDKLGRVTLFDRDGNIPKSGERVEGKDGYTERFQNGITMTREFDGRLSVLFPSGSSVSLSEAGRVTSIRHANGAVHRLEPFK